MLVCARNVSSGNWYIARSFVGINNTRGSKFDMVVIIEATADQAQKIREVLEPSTKKATILNVQALIDLSTGEPTVDMLTRILTTLPTETIC